MDVREKEISRQRMSGKTFLGTGLSHLDVLGVQQRGKRRAEEREAQGSNREHRELQKVCTTGHSQTKKKKADINKNYPEKQAEGGAGPIWRRDDSNTP